MNELNYITHSDNNEKLKRNGTALKSFGKEYVN